MRMHSVATVRSGPHRGLTLQRANHEIGSHKQPVIVAAPAHTGAESVPIGHHAISAELRVVY